MFYKTDHICISTNPVLRLIYLRWLKEVDSEHYREALQKVGEILLSSGTLYMMVDARQLGTPNLEDQHWTDSLFTSWHTSCRIKKVACLLQPELYAYIARYDNPSACAENHSFPFEVGLFGKTLDAYYWLNQDHLEGAQPLDAVLTNLLPPQIA
jgi:hypothetical protein